MFKLLTAPLPWIVASSIISEFGDWLVFLYIAITLGRSTDSAYLLGAFFVVTSLSNIVAAPFAATVIRRVGYARLLFWGRLTQAVIVLLILCLPLSTASGWGPRVLMVLVFPFLKIIDLYIGIGFVALLPRLFSGGQLLRANAAIATANNAVPIIAPVVSGLLVATLDIHWIILMDSLSYIVAGMVLLPVLGLIRQLEVGDLDGGVSREVGGFKGKIKEVLSTIRELPYAKLAVAITLLFGLGGGAINTLMPSYALSLGNELTYGLLTSATGLGFLISSSLLAIAANRIDAKRLLLSGLALIAIVDLLWVFTHSAALAIAIALVNGIGNECYNLGFKTYLQTRTPAPKLVQLYSALAVVGETAGTTAPGIGGVVAGTFGVRAAYAMAGGFAVLALLTSLRLGKSDLQNRVV